MKTEASKERFFWLSYAIDDRRNDFWEQRFAMDIVIRDDERKRAYCIVGDSLFYAHIFNDGFIDSKSWQPIGQELTPYHKDMIEKLKNLHNTTRSLHAPIADFPFL
mgnify:CR=1 FL=1